MRVLAIHRYPLKSAAGERLDTAELTAQGLAGDRMWACLDGEDGTVGSAKQPRRWQRLLDVTARHDLTARHDATARHDVAARIDRTAHVDRSASASSVPGHPTGPATIAVPEHLAGSAMIAVPGHPEAAAGSADADAALSAWLGRPIRLINTVPPEARLRRLWPDEPGMLPEWAADARPGDEAVTLVAAPDGRFFDFGPLHIVTTAELELLGRQHGTAVDPIRFRPNFVLDLPTAPVPGQRLRLGTEAVIEFAIPTPRCIVPSIAHGDAPAEPGLLRTLARHHRTEVPGYGRATCFGHYATVVQPGTVRVADPITPLAC